MAPQKTTGAVGGLLCRAAMLATLFFVLHCAVGIAETPALGAPCSGSWPQEPAPVTLRGTCTAAENGLPLPGVTVTARVDPADADANRPQPVTTGRDGTFAFAVRLRRGQELVLTAEMTGRESRIGRTSRLRAGGTYRADAALPIGTRVTGHVVDAAGAPLQLPLQLTRSPRGRGPTGPADVVLPGAPGPAEPNRGFVPDPAAEPVDGIVAMRAPKHETTSDDRGRFAFDVDVALGLYQVNALKPGFVLREPRSLAVSTRAPGVGLPRIVVDRLPRLAGVVVDEAGRPVRDVVLTAAQTRYGPAIRAVTDADGRFEMARTVHAKDPAELRLESTATCEPLELTRTFTWGDEAVRIELERSPSVPLQVVLAETGEPVTRFSVRAYPLRSTRREFALSRLRLPGPHPDGRVEVDGVRLGPGRIVAVPDDPTLLPVGIDVVGRHGMEPVRIAVQRLVPNAVQVVDGQGEPLAGVEVRVVVPGTARRGKTLLDAREDVVRARSNDTSDTIIHRATTNDAGRCVIYGIGGRLDLELDVVRGGRRFGRFDGIRFGGDAMPFVVRPR